MKKLLTILIISFSFFFASQVKADSTILLDGFEENSTAIFASTTGSVSVTTTHPRTGTYAFYSGGNGGVGAIRPVENTGTGGSTVYTTPHQRLCFYVESFPATENDIFNFYSATPSVKASIRLTSSGQLTFYNRLGTGVGSSTDGLITANTYKCLFVRLISGTSGSLQVREDSPTGSVVVSTTSDFLAVGVQTIRLGSSINATGDTYKIWFDDLMTNSTEFPKVGGIVAMTIDSDGTYTGLNKGTGASNYTQVQQLPPTTATYVAATTSAGTVASSTFNLISAATAGISGTINSIKNQQYVTRLSAFSGTAIHTMYDGSNWLNTATSTWTTNDVFRYKISDVCPNGSACTVSDLDNLQIGVTVGDGLNPGSGRLYDAYLMVDFLAATPSTGGFIWFDSIE